MGAKEARMPAKTSRQRMQLAFSRFERELAKVQGRLTGTEQVFCDAIVRFVRSAQTINVLQKVVIDNALL